MDLVLVSGATQLGSVDTINLYPYICVSDRSVGFGFLYLNLSCDVVYLALHMLDTGSSSSSHPSTPRGRGSGLGW